jgi:hypothetical protein
MVKTWLTHKVAFSKLFKNFIITKTANIAPKGANFVPDLEKDKIALKLPTHNRFCISF